jgi:signal transduction histidine kinase/uncharacterized membrane protein
MLWTPEQQAYWQQRLSVVITTLWLVMAIIIFPVAVYGAWTFIHQPFVGLLVEQSGLINESGAGESPVRWPAKAIDPAQHLPLTLPDQLLAVGEVPFRPGMSIGDALVDAGVKPGDTVRLRVTKAKRGDGNVWIPGETVDVDLPVIAFPYEDRPGYAALPLIMSLAFLVIGLWVYVVRREQAAARTFVTFCASVAVVSGGLLDLWGAHWFTPFWTIMLAVAPGSLIALGLAFPQELETLRRFPFLRWAPYVPSVVIAVVGLQWLYGVPGNPLAYATPWGWAYGYLGFAIAFFLGVLVYRLRTSPSALVRDQSRVILVGGVLGFAPLLVYFIRAYLASLYNQYALAFDPVLYLPSALIFPVAITYALLRYRLLEVDKLINRGLTYGLTAVLLLGAYFLVLALSATWLLGEQASSNPLLVVFFVLAVVIGFNPLYGRVQILVNRMFARGSTDYGETLKRFSHELTLTLDLGRILLRLREEVQGAIAPDFVWVFLRNTRRGGFTRFDTQSLDSVRFALQGPLATWLAAHHTLVLAPGTAIPSELRDERIALSSSGITAAVALTGQQGLLGWLALGGRRGGQRYGTEELAFLESLADQSSLAIERAQVVADLERRIGELNVLSQVSQAVSFTLHFDDLLELIYAQSSKVLDTTNFYITLYDEKKDELSYAFYAENNERRPAREGEHWPLGEGLLGIVVRTGQPVRADDYLAECARRGIKPRRDTHAAWMGVPLNAGATTLGALHVVAPVPEVPYDDEQLKIFWAIADQAATAIEKARYLREIEARARQLATLNEVSSTITSTLDLQTVLNLIMDKAVQILDAEAASLWITDEERNELVFTVNLGPAAGSLQGMRLPLGRGIAGEVAVSGRPVIVNDVANDPRWFKGVDQSTGFVTRAMIVVPLIAKDLIIGVIQVINKRDGTTFSDDDLALLTSFAAQAAAAIENARLFSLTDQALAARLEELSVMQQIDRELNAAGLNLDRVLNLTLEWAMRNTGANAGVVGLVDLEQGGVQLLAMSGYNEDFQHYRAGELWPIDKGIAGRVVRTGQPAIVNDVASDPDYVDASAGGTTRAQLTVPITRESQVVGYIALESDRVGAFKTSDLDFAVRLADHAAVAIENARLYGAVKRANDAKTEFISFVSHELKTPMTSIRGYTDLLEKGLVGPVTPPQQQFLGTIRANVERMSTLVSDLADISRIESGRLRLHIVDVQFRSIVEEALRATQGQINSKNQTLTLDVPDDLPAVRGDQVRLGQVLTNLISNAYKYTPDGGHITVHVGPWTPEGDGHANGEFVICSVTDTGIGISEQDQENLFTKFWRSENPAARQAPGTGLGLNIVKNLVELQGGQVLVSSTLGKGSTFSFTMPIARAAEEVKG